MLPVQCTLDDIHRFVAYLKNKPTGATLSEIKAAIGGADPRKVSGLLVWNLLEKSGDRVKLSDRGWRIARKPAEETDVIKEIIDSVVPYRSVLEWAYHQKLSDLSGVDVAAHWHEHHSDSPETESDRSLKEAALSFFHLCAGARLGKLVIGRRGAPTRLELSTVNLQILIETGPTSLPTSESAVAEDLLDEAGDLKSEVPADENTEELTVKSTVKVGSGIVMKIFITHGKNMTLVDQVETMLGLGGFESEVAEDEETAAIPVPEKVFSAMRRCQAGIIIVSADEADKDNAGKYAINQNVLIEIGAAFVLYDRKVVLVWDKRLPIPSNLQGLYRCEFEGAEFSWTAGMKLMKAIREFRK